MKKTVLIFLSLFILFESAHAWAPPSRFLVDKVALKKKRFRSAYMTVKVSLTSKDLTDSGVYFTEKTLYQKKTGLLTSLVFNEFGDVLYRVHRKLNSIENLENKFSSAVNLIGFHHNSELLAKSLLQLKVPILLKPSLLELQTEEERRAAEKVQLKRLEEKVFWVIAGDFLDPKKSQFWVEKDTFIPRKLYFSRAKKPIEISFNQIRYYQDFPYANQVLMSSKDFTIKAEVVKLIVNAKTDGNLFEENEQGFTFLGQELDYETKRLIKDYYTYLR